MLNIENYLDSAQVAKLEEQLELVLKTLETQVAPHDKAFILWSSAVNLNNIIKELKGE